MIESANPVTAEQMRKFLMSRRTDRRFKPDKPPMEAIEKIIKHIERGLAPSHCRL